MPIEVVRLVREKALLGAGQEMHGYVWDILNIKNRSFKRIMGSIQKAPELA